MNTFDFPIKDLLNKGLRPFEESPRNGSFMTAVSNGRITKGGLVGADKLVRTFDTLDEAAQVFDTYKGIFVLTADELFVYAGTNLVSLLSGLTAGGAWSIADFGEYILFTNGENNLIRDPSTGTFSIDDGAVFPLAESICAHRGRLILGGPKGYPDTSKSYSNWVAWSDINNLKFVSAADISQVRQNLSGYIPMTWKGNVHNVLPLDKHIIVYGDSGISALSLVSTEGVASTYSRTEVHNIGVKWQTSMTTNNMIDANSIHYFVDNLGWLYKIDASLKVEKLGYKEFLS